MINLARGRPCYPQDVRRSAPASIVTALRGLKRSLLLRDLPMSMEPEEARLKAVTFCQCVIMHVFSEAAVCARCS